VVSVEEAVPPRTHLVRRLVGTVDTVAVGALQIIQQAWVGLLSF
jgi:hypothetical protein